MLSCCCGTPGAVALVFLKARGQMQLLLESGCQPLVPGAPAAAPSPIASTAPSAVAAVASTPPPPQATHARSLFIIQSAGCCHGQIAPLTAFEGIGTQAVQYEATSRQEEAVGAQPLAEAAALLSPGGARRPRPLEAAGLCNRCLRHVAVLGVVKVLGTDRCVTNTGLSVNCRLVIL